MATGALVRPSLMQRYDLTFLTAAGCCAEPPLTCDRNEPLPGTKNTQEHQKRPGRMTVLLPRRCHRLCSEQVSVRLVTHPLTRLEADKKHF